MRGAVTGATGTIGRALVEDLLARGDEVTVLSRDAERAREAFGDAVEAVTWRDPKTEPAPVDGLAGRHAVVNLLGEPIAQRWTDEAKREIRDSRVLGTENLVRGLAASEPRPRVLISQSGEGVYPRGRDPVDERAEPARGEFPADVVVAWEGEAMKATDLGLRVVTTRTGVVLSRQGGALATMLPFFRAGVGGPVAGGEQYVSWVHLDDVVGAVVLCLDRDEARGGGGDRERGGRRGALRRVHHPERLRPPGEPSGGRGGGARGRADGRGPGAAGSPGLHGGRGRVPARGGAGGRRGDGGRGRADLGGVREGSRGGHGVPR